MQFTTGNRWVIRSLCWLAVASRCAAQPPAVEEERKHADRLAAYGLFDQAAEAYRKLLEVSPEDSALKLALASVYAKDSRFEDAQKELKALLEHNTTVPQKALAHAWLGEVFRKQGQRDQARQEYEVARQLVGGNADNIQLMEASARAGRGLGLLDWEKVEAQKTVVSFAPGSLDKARAQETAEFLESRIAIIEKFSGRPFTGRVEVYYFTSREQFRNIVTDWPWGAEAALEKTIYMMEGRSFFNAMRTLSFYVGNADMKDVPKSSFVADGFAVLYSGGKTWGRRLAGEAYQMKQQGKLPPLTELLKATSEDKTVMAFGASFVWYLVNTYGEAKFTEFWKAFNDNANALSEVYGKTVAEIETEWLATIQ